MLGLQPPKGYTGHSGDGPGSVVPYSHEREPSNFGIDAINLEKLQSERAGIFYHIKDNYIFTSGKSHAINCAYYDSQQTKGN